jgi:MFS family permease
LIADITPSSLRGRSFGLRQALDTVGAVGGPLLALGGMIWFAGNFQAVFWIAVVPAVLCVVLIVFGVDEPHHPREKAGDESSWRITDWKRLPAPFWFVVAIAAVLTLARFSEAFLLLRAQNVGFSEARAPLVMVVMSFVYAITAYPTGVATDRGWGPWLLGAGLLALIAADLVLARASVTWAVIVGAALWGLHMGLTQGLLAALVAAAAPADLRGTAFGVFNLMCGIALLIASALAGWLWDVYGPAFTFYVGAAFTALAGVGLLLRRREVFALGISKGA